jgi:hypothetical protein
MRCRSFRGDIRRCNYKLQWLDENKGIHECYAAVRGPVETKINFIQKHQISVDTPNHSVNILMPKRKDVLEYFKRYSKFYLSPSMFEEDPENQYEEYRICFRVEATDWISTPGVFEITAVEYYSNEHEDDIEHGLVIGNTHFKAFDSKGKELEQYPQKDLFEPSDVGASGTFTASVAFALNNDDDYLKIEYYKDISAKKPDVVFEQEW